VGGETTGLRAHSAAPLAVLAGSNEQLQVNQWWWGVCVCGGGGIMCQDELGGVDGLWVIRVPLQLQVLLQG